MEIKEYEEFILSELKIVIENILSINPNPNISAKSRAGSEISSLLEEEFVKETQNHSYFKNSIAAPKSSTKHPFDAQTFFHLNSHCEKIWIDFKAFKISSKNSNPAIGSTSKIIDLIKDGNFYLVYVFVYYEETKNGLKFVENSDHQKIKTYFLKDVSKTFRRDPTGQLQVNFKASPEYRTREDFLNMFVEKMKEGYKRQIKNAEEGLNKIKKEKILETLFDANKCSEDKIKNL